MQPAERPTTSPFKILLTSLFREPCASKEPSPWKTTDLVINGCDTLEFGDAVLENNGLISVDSCAAMIGNGDLFLENDLTNTVNGYIRVNGDVEARNAASISGDGNLSTSGSITYFNTAAIFGSSTDCATGPCFVGTGFPLPIELLYFREIEGDDQIALEWDSLQESFLLEYHIQRSFDFVEWECMHIEEIDGQSCVAKVYQHQSPHFFEQTSYFRLMSVDFNGFRSFSEVIVVESRTKPTKVYPNPFHGTLQIPCSEIACAVFLFDLQGAVSPNFVDLN
jgi:hypothetical protein